MLEIGEKFAVASKVLKEERAYWVALPNSYEGDPRWLSRYPVLYLLDAEDKFQAASAVAEFLSRMGYIPELILVGVTNTDRVRDFTPTHSTKNPDGTENPRASSSGGANRFLEFLETELIPEVEQRYKTLPFRVLAGHSASGLFGAHVFLKAPTLFQGVVAADPSLWIDEQEVVRRAAQALVGAQGLARGFYMSSVRHAIGENVGSKTAAAAIPAFAQVLTASRSPKLRFKLEHFENEDHQSVPLVSLYHGLRFLFDGYKLPLEAAVKDPGLIFSHYQELSRRLGTEFKVPESAFSLVAGELLFDKQDFKKSIELLERYSKMYPGSFDARHHLGFAYLMKGDKSQAVHNFQKALELRPGDADVTEQLKRLQP